MSSFIDNELFTDFDSSAAYDSENKLLSSEQVSFFKQSQCRDSSNRLLVLYHASNKDFTYFDPDRIGLNGGYIYGKGFYFCDNSFLVTDYGKYIKEFYLNLKKPFIWKMAEEDTEYLYNLDLFIEILNQNSFTVTKELKVQLEDDLLECCGGLDTIIEMTCGVNSAQQYFIKAGYDGIINLETGDYVAFKPEQIKLCSNRQPSATNNIAA